MCVELASNILHLHSGSKLYNYNSRNLCTDLNYSGMNIITPILNDIKSRNKFEPSKNIVDESEEFILCVKQLQEAMKRLTAEIERGLSKATHEDADVKCLPTYVQDLPSGKEQGNYLALDLGGTNFRVLFVKLTGPNEFQMKSKIYAIADTIKTDSGAKLFDHIAECLADFMKEHQIHQEQLSLGFTFSFPVIQIGLTEGLLIQWTKDFYCSDVIGKDVVQYLKDAIARRGDIQINIYAILNDTTGTLMSCAWSDRNCKIGLIVGTGCNACYVENVENVENFVGKIDKSHVVINTEWGAFGNNGALDFIRTKYDRILDEQSNYVGKQIYEKMMAGLYLGELVRLVLVNLTQLGLLFDGQDSDQLNTRNRFDTKYVSAIETDIPGSFNHCRAVLNEIGLRHATKQDCVNVRYICECISRRAAHLVSVGIATLINRMDEPNVTIGADGSVYRFHPHFQNMMNKTIRQLVKSNCRFKMMLSEDGSGRGAALVAAVAATPSEERCT